uniref:Tail tubular protein B n=1 Tax=Escherichia virus LS2 TaxID=2743776 RepID=A0A7D5FN29_9CAUD
MFDIQGTGTENYICVNSTGAYNRIYIYKFLFKDGVQLQASWSHWEFPKDDKILASASIGSTMFIVRQHQGGVDIEHLKFIKEATDSLRAIFDIQGTGTENYICVNSTGAYNRIYIYKFLFKDGVQLQASWSHWEFPKDDKILASASIGSTMFIVRQHQGGVDIEHLKFIKEATDSLRAISGNQYSVSGAVDYVKSSNPRDDIRVVTVADYTFVVNRKVVVKGGSEKSHSGYNRKARALINLRGGQYGRTLKVGINGGVKVSHKLPAGNDAENDPPKVDAQAIGAALRDLLVAAYPTFTFDLGSGFLLITAPSGTDINSVETEDGYANQLISPVLDTVQTISKLPLAAPNGYIIKIQGETNSSADEYYVMYDSNTKTWKETVEPGVVTGFDNTTMPHALVRQSDGSFEFKTLIGPSVVLVTMTQTLCLASWMLRLMMCSSTGTGSGNQYSVSGAVDYVKSSNPRDDIRVVTVADYTFVVNRKVVVKGGSEKSHSGYNRKARALINLRGGQYGRTLKVGINGGVKVSHKLPAGNDAENDPPKVDAQAIGAALRDLLVAAYPTFTFDLGSGFLLITAPSGTDINSVETEDGYANQLISPVLDTVQTISKLPLAAPNGYIIKIQGETNSSADEYYVMYDSNTKTWKETVEPGVVTGFDNTTMPHALVRQSDGSFEFKTLIGPSVVLVTMTQTLCLASWMLRLMMCSSTGTGVIPIGSYNADTYKTTVDIGASYGGNAPSPGRYYLIDSQGAYVDLGDLSSISTVITLNGDWSGRTVFIGRPYLMSYKFSRFLIKIEDDSGTQSEDTGRLQLRRAWVNYKDTGALRLIVRNGEREFVNTFNGYTLGQQTIGLQTLVTGSIASLYRHGYLYS